MQTGGSICRESTLEKKKNMDCISVMLKKFIKEEVWRQSRQKLTDSSVLRGATKAQLQSHPQQVGEIDSCQPFIYALLQPTAQGKCASVQK